MGIVECAGAGKLTEVLEAASGIEGIEIEPALRRIGGKQKVLVACMEQVAASAGGILENMQSFLYEGDLRGFSIEAHGLKNALAGIGAAEHSKLASELEAESKAGNALMCEVKFKHFDKALQGLVSRLTEVLPKTDGGGKQKGDGKLLLEVINETAGYINDFEADDALSCLERLEGYSYGAEPDRLLGLVKGRIKAYKYEESIAILKKIKAQV